MPLSSVFGAIGSAMQADSAANQVKAQREENEKNRLHNLNLAKLQNKWNLEQWQRETAYNSPKSTMERFVSAGLNPNLIYGQSNNAPSLAGSMTSGAPSSPADLSAMSLRGQGLSSAMRHLGDALMKVPLYREQVDSLRLDNEAKRLDNQGRKLSHTGIGLDNKMREVDLWNKNRDKYIRELLSSINGSDESITELLNSKEFEHSPYSAPEVRRALYEYRKMSASAQDRWMEHLLKTETYEDALSALAAKYQIEYVEAQRAFTLADDILAAEKNELNIRKATKTFGQIARADNINFKEFMADLMDILVNALISRK